MIMTMKEKLIEMVNYLGVKTDLMVFDPSEKIVDHTGHRLNRKIVTNFGKSDGIESRAERIEEWLQCNTNGPNNDFRKIYIFADMDTLIYFGSTPYLDEDTRIFAVLD
jgi:hypothetical protein